MPDLSTKLHTDMLKTWKKRNSFPARIFKAVKKGFLTPDIYGLQWGDPEVVEPLRFVRDHYVLPYINPLHQAVEIGPGGGRWTRYLIGFQKLFVIDYYQQLLDELRKNLKRSNLFLIKNNGADFPGVSRQSIDFLFSFGTFVHLDAGLIAGYLKNIREILKPGASAVIHYSDQTKIMARLNPSFSDNNPEKMRSMVVNAGFQVLEEDLTTMWHSSIIRFSL